MSVSLLALSLIGAIIINGVVGQTLILIDFATNSGSASAPWITITPPAVDAIIDLGNGAFMQCLDQPWSSNNPGAPTVTSVLDGITVPLPAKQDYMYLTTDTGR